MPIRCAYEGVRKLQTFLRNQGYETVVTGTAEGIEGRYGADAEAGTAVWLAGRPVPASLAELVLQEILSTRDMAEVLQAMAEHARVVSERITESLPCTGLQAPFLAQAEQAVAQKRLVVKAEEGGIPTWGWFLIGLGVLTAGYFGYKYLIAPKSKAAAGLGDEETGDFGGGCDCGG